MSAPAPAKTPRRKKAAPADELPADVSALQAEIHQLRADLYRAQQQLVPRSPAELIAMLEHIYTKAQNRTSGQLMKTGNGSRSSWASSKTSSTPLGL